MFKQSTFRKSLVCATCLAAPLMLAAPANATVITKFFMGVVDSSGLNGLPATTPFSGSFSYDDATADTNPSPAVGAFATGSFTIDFGGLVLTAGAGTTTRTTNDLVVFLSITEDRFTLNNFSVGSTGIDPVISAGIFFIDSENGVNPTAMSSDALTGLLLTTGAPWDEVGININFSNNEGNCTSPFVSNCFVNGTLTALSDDPFNPRVPEPASMLLLGAGLAGLGAVRRRRK